MVPKKSSKKLLLINRLDNSFYSHKSLTITKYATITYLLRWITRPCRHQKLWYSTRSYTTSESLAYMEGTCWSCSLKWYWLGKTNSISHISSHYDMTILGKEGVFDRVITNLFDDVTALLYVLNACSVWSITISHKNIQLLCPW